MQRPLLFRALAPTNAKRYPQLLLTPEQQTVAIAALKENENLIGIKSPFEEALHMIQDQSVARKAKPLFEQVTSAYRQQLYLGGINDPVRRLAIHEALMAAGYYARATDLHAPKIDGYRFVMNHYNIDVRKDKILGKEVHQALVHEAPTAISEAVTGNLFLLERYLYGANRLLPVRGYKTLVHSLELRDFVDEAALQAVLQRPPCQAFANIQFEVQDNYEYGVDNDRWKVGVVTCGPEPEQEQGEFCPPLVQPTTEATRYQMKLLTPEPILPFMERLKLKLLDLWVYVFAGWVAFWAVDEEIFTLIGLIYARYSQMKILAEESKKSGGKLYVARGKFH